MKNTIPYFIVTSLLLSKAFAWWLLFFGSNILDVEATLSNLFQPLHQFSYLTLSTVLVIGIMLRSKFALLALLLTAPINLAIYLFNGTSVYQSLLDPIALIAFITIVIYRKKNHWYESLKATN